ncbi:ABC transporter substrate-binding protein [Xanthobacter autotrophicus DSM 431]|uniref:ABC transporter substrate-binding protein n=1 Tax=Xanthobacter nonsaccharivorans TaxID=3119912 RepID=UPI00372840DB
MRRLFAYVIAVQAALIGFGGSVRIAAAQVSDDVVKIGVLNDQAGSVGDIGGKGSVVMAQLAIEDFGGQVLGKPVKLIFADHQNKADIASAIARRWVDVEQVDAIVDGASSSAALTINEVTRNARRVFMSSGAATTELTGASCSPTTVQFNYDTFMLANGTVKAMLNQGYDTWYLLTADYAFGYSLEADVSRLVRANGGKMLGSVRHPLNASDFSSFLLQAQASNAKAIGLADAGTDTINAVKQAAEFGVSGRQRLAGLLVEITDVHALGLAAAQGMLVTTSFYWDLNEETRALTRRFAAAMGGDRVPTAVQAGVYAAVRHYLRAVQVAGTDDALKVVQQMKALPIDDPYNKGVQVREDGRVMHDVYLMQVKSPSESRYPFDYYKVVQKMRGEDVFRPLAEGGCPLVKKP